MTLKQLLIISLLFPVLIISVVFIPDTATAQTETEPADNFQLQTYLTEEQALDLVFPECDEIVADEFVMTGEEKNSLEKMLSRRLYEDGFRVYLGKKEGTIRGYAIITEEIGKFHPFSFIVAVNPDGKIYTVAVLVYRESRGGEVARKRFIYQFIGKSLKNPIRINKDIINVTGATMSVQYMCAGVRKVLTVINEYYLSGKRSVSNLKVAQSSAITEGKEESTTIANTAQNTKDTATPPVLNKKKSGLSDIQLIKQTRMIMGTFAEVSIYSHDEKTAGRVIEESLDEMERMDRIMSNYKEESDLSRLNKKAVKSPTPCNKELLEVIEQSLYYSELSGGAFDITVSPIVALWGFFREQGRVPAKKEIEKLLPAVSCKNIVINKSADPEIPATIFFKNTQTQIELGAIGKGYAVDKALEVIKKSGVNNGCINLGGNIYVMGAPPDKKAWRIGVQHPRNSGEILGYLELNNEATATSGDYERFFEFNGKRYSHIINPQTGRPVSGTIATTIVAPSGTEVDALSTIVFVLGHEKGMEIVKRLPDVDAMIAYEEKGGKIAIDMTKGFKDKFKITNEGENNVKWHVVASD